MSRIDAAEMYLREMTNVDDDFALMQRLNDLEAQNERLRLVLTRYVAAHGDCSCRWCTEARDLLA